MKKRILQIVPTLDRAGAEKQMTLLARGLPRELFDVHLCALAGGGPLAGVLTAAGIPVTPIGRRWLFDLQAYRQLHRHVARLRPNLIHTWRAPAGAYGRAAASACGVKHLVASRQGVGGREGWFERVLDRLVARRASRVVVNSRAVGDFYLAGGLPAERIRVIPNGVPPARPSRTTRRQLLAELGLPGGSRLVGLVGRLCLHKRIKDAIWAADLLKVIRDDVHLLVIGAGPQRQRLRIFRDQCVIGDKVHLLGERGDVPRLLPYCDVFWSTAGPAGPSNAVMEAMAAGVPVVASDVPGTRELVVPEQTGYLVPVGDRAALARRTNKLLDDPALAQRLGQAGRERMQREFSVEKMVERYVGLYGELLE